ncbi:hypothetical protein ACJX0J_042190, partial [Zea mays]
MSHIHIAVHRTSLGASGSDFMASDSQQ